MSIELIKSNIAREKELAQRLEELSEKYLNATESEKQKIKTAIESTIKQIQILNDSIPLLVKSIFLTEDVQKTAIKNNIVGISYNTGEGERLVAINKKDRGEYLEHLHISETSLKSIRKAKEKQVYGFGGQFKKPNKYVQISNKLFIKTTMKWVNKGYFVNLKKNLQKGNFMILLSSYVSTMFFTTLLSFFAAILLIIFFMFFGLISEPPFIYLVKYTGTIQILMRFLQFGWLIIAVPVITFILFLSVCRKVINRI